MSRSISKGGFTLIELLCSLGVFSIIFMSVISYGMASENIKKDIKNINHNVLIMETLKNNIIYVMNFEELQLLKNHNRTFIDKENLTFYKFQTSLMNIFTDIPSKGKPYIELRFLKCELQVYTLGLFLYSEGPNEVIELQCNFYKGCHK